MISHQYNFKKSYTKEGKNMASESKQMKIIIVLSVALAVTVAAASFFGIFVSGTYERETASLAAQGIGQDIVNLFLAVPLLVISLIFMLRECRFAFFIYGGTVFYFLYSYVIYSLGIHFNSLFLLYCIILGLSVYSFILIVHELSKRDITDWFKPKVPVRTTGIYLLFVSVMFYFLWLKELIPAVMNNTIPKSVSDYNLLVNPVHVIDIAFALPGLIISAVLLMKKNRFGYILTPISLVFVIILAVALAAMVLMVKIRDLSDEGSVAVIFVVLTVISAVFLFLFLKNLIKREEG
jgi:hypothetical protein